MPKFGKSSKKRLDTLDSRLVKILNEAIKYTDFSIICGHRGMAAQKAAFILGKSQLDWPNSKHNTVPSCAVDIAPWDPTKKGIDWEDINRFYFLAGVINTVAQQMDIPIVWGGDWESLRDYPHFQLG